MSYVSRVTQQDFFSLLSRIEGQTPEPQIEYPMEYFIGETFIFLYKQLSHKIYKTSILLFNNTGFYKNQQMSVEQILTDLKVNHKAIELIEPIDIKDLILKHNHDSHSHAGHDFNDLFDIYSSPGTEETE